MYKEILFKTLRHEDAGQVPWVPFSGVHSGKLKGYNAIEVLTDPDKCLESLVEVNKLYRPFGQPVYFDLQLEAECLGCDLIWAEKGPPSVSSHPLEGDDPEVPCVCTIPTKESGRFPMVLDVMRRLKAEVGGDTALYGLICGPFTLAGHLRGNDLFLDMYDNEEFTDNLIDFCAKVVETVAGFYREAGMDIIAVVDPLISQISSEHFERFMTGRYTELFKTIKNLGVFTSFFVCGDATRNIENMCKTGPDCVSIDENIDFKAAKKITDRYNIVIGGNIQLTVVMLHGSQQDNMKAVIDELDSVDTRKNMIVSPGCDMPYDIPIENTIGAAQALIDEAGVREILKNYTRAAIDTSGVVIPDYAKLGKPLVEVFTLDSATCAACTYMMNAANIAKKEYGDRIDLIEYKYTVPANIARCVKMGVPNLPSLYINGKLAFRSIIPSRDELNAAINAAIRQPAV
ncbi:MAG: uroporphyrinogen decarboxylase [Treponema sp.]|jgi:uroporphyrinogen decarboxylase|nr:uroporphyrinogen decarboxylase [Treponema sp.]